MQALRINASYQQGFSLIEILIATFVISVGLIGQMAVQQASVQNNQSAMLRSQMIVLAQDVVDRMRLNPQGIEDGWYDDVNIEFDVEDEEVLNTSINCLDAYCSAQNIALDDQRRWVNDLSTITGNATLVIDRDDTITAYDAFDISLSWVENDGNAGRDVTHTFGVAF